MTDPKPATGVIVSRRHLEPVARYYAARLWGRGLQVEMEHLMTRLAGGDVDPLALLFAQFERDHLATPVPSMTGEGECRYGCKCERHYQPVALPLADKASARELLELLAEKHGRIPPRDRRDVMPLRVEMTYADLTGLLSIIEGALSEARPDRGEG